MNESNPSDATLVELLSLTMEVNDNGATIYRNHLGNCHRIHGPAVIWADGEKWWIQHGQLHRTGGPAIEWSHGGMSWYLNNERLTADQWNERIKSI